MGRGTRGGKRAKTTAQVIQERTNQMMRMVHEQGSKVTKTEEYKNLVRQNAEDYAKMTGRKLPSKFAKKNTTPKQTKSKPKSNKPKTGKAVQSDFTKFINNYLKIDLNSVRTNEAKFDNRNGFNISAKALGINGMNTLKNLARRGTNEFDFSVEENGADRIFVRVKRK